MRTLTMVVLLLSMSCGAVNGGHLDGGQTADAGQSGLGRACAGQAACDTGLTCLETEEGFFADGGGASFSECTKRCSSAAACTATSAAGTARTGACRTLLVNDGNTYCAFSPAVE